MKIILLVPPVIRIIDPSLPSVLQSEEDPMPPLGLMYLASYLLKNSTHSVKIIDCELEKINHEQLREILINEKPDVVGITTMTFTLPAVLSLVDLIKEIDPAIKTVLGGPHVFIYPKETINLPGIDFLVLGEGEITFKELLDNLYEPAVLRQIKGLVFKDGKEIVNTGLRPAIADLDELPFPARELLPYERYHSALSEKYPVTTMFTSRGCPFNCLFCDRPHLGKNFRCRSASNVVKEMETCAQMGIKEIFIYDDTFTVNRQRVVDICQKIISRGININWDIRARVDTVDLELLTLMKQAGCVRIHYGVEAGTQKILNVLRKGITIEKVINTFANTQKLGIMTLAYFMIGSPEETKEDIAETIKLALAIKPDFVSFSITTPYPSTPLYQMGLDSGVLTSDYWLKFAQNPTQNFFPPVWEEKLSQKELTQMIKKAYWTFYFRPQYLLKRLSKISSFKELIYKLKAGLRIFRI